MKILLVNPPNCGRSIPEERYGISSLKQIFRGEPLALEELAGNLTEHQVEIVDLKAEPDTLASSLDRMQPDVVGITGVTCEANTMLRLAKTAKSAGATVVAGGIHASNDPHFFNQPQVDFIVTGLGKKSFAQLLAQLDAKSEDPLPAGIYRSQPGQLLPWRRQRNVLEDLASEVPPAYHLTAAYRPQYLLERLNITVGFVASAYGCPHACSFCAIAGQTGGSYLPRPAADVVRDVTLLADIPVIRLVDENSSTHQTKETEYDYSDCINTREPGSPALISRDLQIKSDRCSK